MPRPSRTAVLVTAAGLLAGVCAWDLTSSPLDLAVALGATVGLAIVCWREGLDRSGRPSVGSTESDGSAEGVDVPAEGVDVRGLSAVVTAVLLLGAVGVAVRPFTKDVTAGWLFWTGLAVLAASAMLMCLTLWRPRRSGSRVGWAALAAAMVGLAAVVAGSTRPRIDVWVLLQGAAHGVLTGRNPYALTFPGAPRGQTTQCFTYLPGSFLLGAPGRLVGDVRWAELVVLVVGWLALALAVRRRARGNVDTASQVIPLLTAPVLALVTFALVMPATVRVVQQSWTDSLLVGLVLLAVALVIRDHRSWAMIPLAAGLATKQHVALLLPLVLIWWGWRRCLAVIGGAVLICAPWLLAAPARMWTCGVTFFLDLPATHDSISYWRFLPAPVRLPVVLALTVAAIWLCWRRLPRTPPGFLLGAAVVNAAFDIANKQSYLNQWWFVAQLVLAAVVVGIAAPDTLSGVTTGAVTRGGEPSGAAGVATSYDDIDVAPPDRRQLLRLIGGGGDGRCPGRLLDHQEDRRLGDGDRFGRRDTPPNGARDRGPPAWHRRYRHGRLGRRVGRHRGRSPVRPRAATIEPVQAADGRGGRTRSASRGPGRRRRDAGAGTHLGRPDARTGRDSHAGGDDEAGASHDDGVPCRRRVDRADSRRWADRRDDARGGPGRGDPAGFGRSVGHQLAGVVRRRGRRGTAEKRWLSRCRRRRRSPPRRRHSPTSTRRCGRTASSGHGPGPDDRWPR